MPPPPRLSDHFDLVIFDWAGTVVDFGCQAPVIALQQAFSRHGVSLTEADARRDMGKAKADHVRALLADVRIAEAWRIANGTGPTAGDCGTLMADLGPLMRDQAERAATLIDGVRTTVDGLRAAGCLTVGVTASGNGVGLSPAALAALPDLERHSLIALAEKALYAAGADIVLESVATLVPALERYAEQHANP